MESFFPFIREWTERVTIVIVTMLGISQIFLAEFLLYYSFSSAGVNQSGGKASAARPVATLGDDCLDSELIVLISGLSAAIMCFVICPLCLRLHVCILLFQLSHALLQKCTRVGELSGRWSASCLSPGDRKLPLREKGDVDVNVNQRQSGDERANVAPRFSHFRSPLSFLTLPVDPDAADADAHFSRVWTDQGKHPRPSGLNQDQIRYYT